MRVSTLAQQRVGITQTRKPSSRDVSLSEKCLKSPSSDVGAAPEQKFRSMLVTSGKLIRGRHRSQSGMSECARALKVQVSYCVDVIVLHYHCLMQANRIRIGSLFAVPYDGGSVGIQ